MDRCHHEPDSTMVGPPDHRSFSWDTAPTFLIRDNDCAYGEVFTRRVRSMGFATALSRLDRHGRMDMSSAQSARSDVSVLTT